MTATLQAIDVMVRETVLRLVARGVPLPAAAEQAGTSLRSVNALRKADPEFEEDLSEAQQMMVARVDDTRNKGAIDGDAKMMELFYREFKPHIAATGGQQGRGGAIPAGHSGPLMQVQSMSVAIIQNIIMSDDQEVFLKALEPARGEIIEAQVVEDERPDD
jgi:hypothetical protein